MAKLDSDIRNLFHHLYFYTSDSWDHMYSEFLISPDTEKDAEDWVEPESGTDKVQFKKVVRDFVIQAESQLVKLPPEDFIFGYPIFKKPRQRGELRPCFLAMPTLDWLPEVRDLIEKAAVGFECELSVDNAIPGDIMGQVWRSIRQSDVIVADLTGLNPNVFYEMGLAHALGKKIIMIMQESSIPVPFDVGQHKSYMYDFEHLDELQAWLDESFRSVQKRYKFDSASYVRH